MATNRAPSSLPTALSFKKSSHRLLRKEGLLSQVLSLQKGRDRAQEEQTCSEHPSRKASAVKRKTTWEGKKVGCRHRSPG